MNPPPRLRFPPAPPPQWQTDPVVAPDRDSGGNAGVVLGVSAIGFILILGLMILVIRNRRSRRTDLRFEELRLRNSLTESIGPDAAWLSAEAIGERLQGEGDRGDEAVAKLAAIEASRFGRASAIRNLPGE